MISETLLQLPGYREARTVCAYSSFQSEFDTCAFVAETLARGKTLLLPRVDRDSRSLVFYRIADPARDLVAATWGIREPDPARCAQADLGAVDFMLVPGVAFSRDCQRLGYGGGFYDRTIGRLPERTTKIAGAFSLQVLGALPVGPRDRKVDGVVTERSCFGNPAQQVV